MTWHPCPEGCIDKVTKKPLQFKRKSDLGRHMRFTHNFPGKRFACTECDIQPFRSKYDWSRRIVTHGKYRDLIVWQKCSYCGHETKRGDNLKTHMEAVHDIGPYKCDICCGNRLTHRLFEDKTGSYHICKQCYAKATNQKSRVETVWSAYLDEHVGKDFLLGSDDALRSLGGCSRLRPDKIYNGPHLTEVDECDEHQHATGNYPCVKTNGSVKSMKKKESVENLWQ